jgi:enoyl-CoA hydratase/carnithine racemase
MIQMSHIREDEREKKAKRDLINGAGGKNFCIGQNLKSLYNYYLIEYFFDI